MEWNEELMSIVEPEPVENGLSAEMQERAKAFGKWMWLYFLLMIQSIIPGIIAVVEEQFQTGTIIGTLLGWIYAAAMLYAMFQLGRVQDRLRTCAILNAVALAAQIILYFVNSEMLTDLWDIPSFIMGLVVSYQLMHGCGDALAGVDNEQSNKWYRLWKWYVGLLIGGVVGVPAVISMSVFAENEFLLIIAVIAMLAWAGMLIVQLVKEYVYIYRTAKIFRGIAENL